MALPPLRYPETALYSRGPSQHFQYLEIVDGHGHAVPVSAAHGVVGILRDFSKNPRDLRAGYETAMKRRKRLPPELCLEKSRELAQPRIRQMDELFEALHADSAGHF